jgi:hypothetical protein
MENKYIILKMDCTKFNIDVIGTFNEKKDALEFMALEITRDEKIESSWYQKIFDSDDIISIYEIGYVMKKSLKYKYFIKKY